MLDYTETPTISRELLLCKVSTLGPEFFENQLSGTSGLHQHVLQAMKSEEKTTKMEALAESFERSGEPVTPPSASQSLSQVLRNRHIYFAAIRAMTDQFGGKIVDIAETNVIIELTGKSSRVEAFLELMRPFGVLEAARTGTSSRSIQRVCEADH